LIKFYDEIIKPIFSRVFMTMIYLQGLSLSFSHKTYFSEFTGSVGHGQRIAIVGDNGVGKSSLLKILSGELTTSPGSVRRAAELTIGYVPQVQGDEHVLHLSGGERVNHALSQALAGLPDLLLLDEPTNNLDWRMRQHVIQIVRCYPGAMILISHDEEFLCQVAGLRRLELRRTHITGSELCSTPCAVATGL
jgi:ATPase subunit of ABC transporter with duplicated ATPase domains